MHLRVSIAMSLSQHPALWQLPSNVTHPRHLRAFGEEQGTRSSSTGTHSTSGCGVTLCICLDLSNKQIRKSEKSKTQGLGLSFGGIAWVTPGELSQAFVSDNVGQGFSALTVLFQAFPCFSKTFFYFSHCRLLLKRDKEMILKSTFFTILCIRHQNEMIFQIPSNSDHSVIP